MTCRETATLLARGDLDDAAWPRRLLARLHLLYCRHCRRYQRELETLARAARAWAAALTAGDPSFEQRLIRKLSPSS